MRTVTIDKTIENATNPNTSWIEPGDYEFVRIFDSKRVMIRTNQSEDAKRQVTLVKFKDIATFSR